MNGECRVRYLVLETINLRYIVTNRFVHVKFEAHKSKDKMLKNKVCVNTTERKEPNTTSK
jgi:hypothetical protein